ncbi:hypothetical protein B0H17DRAFT_1152128 [Mycena rosella]|uniref:Uncharacterized protein n=1 Tax=Mycena rosella TaxID=1033263 RepID=A0AAD7BEV1_MYCRO|nr:hypothetical protein B0H17DRAFT_1152128 [Mycena rosella]
MNVNRTGMLSLYPEEADPCPGAPNTGRRWSSRTLARDARELPETKHDARHGMMQEMRAGGPDLRNRREGRGGRLPLEPGPLASLLNEVCPGLPPTWISEHNDWSAGSEPFAADNAASWGSRATMLTVANDLRCVKPEGPRATFSRLDVRTDAHHRVIGRL